MDKPIAAPPDSSARRDLWLACAVGVVSFVMAWWVTGPSRLILVNWDQSAYLATLARGQSGWSGLPWNNHFAVGHQTQLCVRVARALGGSTVDGFRLLKALFFAALGASFAYGAARLSRSIAIAIALTAVFLCAFVQLFLVATIEWNVDLLAPACGMLVLATTRAACWRPKHSIATGLMGAVGGLISLQSVPYLFAGLYAALLGGPRRSVTLRLRDAALIPVSFVSGLLAWSALVAATSERGFVELVRIQVRPPTPSILPPTIGELLHRFIDMDGALRSIGIGMGYMVRHQFTYHLPVWQFGFVATGAVVLTVILGMMAIALWRGVRKRQFALHLLAMQLLVVLALTLIVRELPAWEYAYMKRYNFVPLIIGLILAQLLGDVAIGSRVRRGLIAAALIGLAVTELSLYLRFRNDWLGARPELASYLHKPHPEASWYGRAGRSWFGYYRQIREQHPNACRYVLALDEVEDGSWNFDVIGSLYSELPEHVIVGDPRKVAGWRYPPHMMTAGDLLTKHLEKDCAWVSRDAQKLLDGAGTTH